MKKIGARSRPGAPGAALALAVLFTQQIAPHPVFGESGAGSTSFQFLRVGVGARPVALAGAYVGYEGDVWSGFWNPAGLGTLAYKEFGLSHHELGEGVRQEIFSYAHPWGRRGVLGLSGSWLKVADIQGYDPGGAKQGEVQAGSYYAAASFARRVRAPIGSGPEGLYLGSSLKYFRETLDADTASGLAADGGVLWYIPGGHTVAASFSNLGPKAKFVSEKEALPLQFSLGGRVAWALWGQAFRLSTGVQLPRENDPYIVTGLEAPLADLVALRFGYTTGDDLSSGFRAGLGFRVRSLSLDYAFLPQGDLEQAHRFSLSFRFGRNVKYLAVEAELKEAYEAAAAAFNQGQWLRSRELLKMVLDAAPGHARAQDLMAKVELKLREASVALEIKERLERGQRLAERGEHMQALAELKAVLEMDPDNEIAKKFMEGVRANYQKTVEALIVDAEAHLNAKRLQEASAQIERAKVLDPENERIQVVVQRIEEESRKLEELKRKGRAKELLQKALLAEEKGNWEAALPYLVEAQKLDPQNAEIAQAKARIALQRVPQLYEEAKELARQGKNEKALRKYEEILAASPGEGEAKRLAEEMRKAVAAQRREEAQGLNKKALELYSQGKLEEAAKKWEEALALSPDLEAARLNLERVKKELGRKKK